MAACVCGKNSMITDELPYRYDVDVVGLVASAEHRYDGRPADDVPAQQDDRRQEVLVRAGSGIVGDRYFGRPAHRNAAVSVLAVEGIEALAGELGLPVPGPLLARRNVVLRGAEVEALRGHVFSLDCGAGEVGLRGGRPANPCAWLDVALGPGFHRGLRGRAGIRCGALSDGVLRLGPAVLRCAVPLDPDRAGAVHPLRPTPRATGGVPGAEGVPG